MPSVSNGGGSVSSSNIVDGTIVNADINAAAAIAATKLLGDDTIYSAAWDGDTKPPSKNTVYDKIESIVTLSAKSLIPVSNIHPHQNSAPSLTPVSSNTTMLIGQIFIPFRITANQISITTINNGGTSGTLDITMYSEDGQTQIFSVTTASINAASNVITSTALSAVVIERGIYYIAINPNGTANLSTYFYTTSGTVFGTTLSCGLPGNVTSKPVMHGTLTITAGTPPATITPSAITFADNSTLICRLDN